MKPSFHLSISYGLLAGLLIGAALALVSLSGCAAVRDNLDLTTADQYGEAAFQVEHLVDVVQTMHGAASDKCFSEGDPLTRRIIGAHPSQAATLVWGAGFGALHFGITDWLLSNGHDRIAAVWEAASIIDTAAVINHNYSVGVRIGAPNHDDAACLKYYGGEPTGPTSPFSPTAPPTTTFLRVQH